MPVILFLIDTSASMNQRSHLGTTYLDIAKGAVETFLKLRSRDPASRGDRYMLVSFEEAPAGIKAGWKDSHATFMTELRNLQAIGLTPFGQTLRTSFDLLNLNRLVSGIDNYGQGRNPFFLEPAIIVAITDGSKLTSTCGVQDELHLPLTTPLPGSELTKEPFRWDQRLFSLVLRIPGHASLEPEPLGGVPPDASPVTPMCEVTGGRSYSVFSQRMLNQCLESLVQKIQSGVVINFEKTGPDPAEDGPVDVKCGPQPWHSCHRLIYVRPNPKTGVPVGHWPIPESFWPDQNSPSLPPRMAHPQVRFSCVEAEPMVVDKVPFDKYELEPSPLTQYILERKSPHTCWQVFVSNSAKYGDLGQPFGYLKASTALNCVNLFVMPYNYPVVLPLLDDLIRVHKFKPTVKWRQSFETYLKTMPPYYITPLRKALRMMGAPNLLADNMEYGLSYSVVSYLKKLSQQAKVEADRVCALVGKKAGPDAGIKLRSKSSALSLAHRKDFTQLLQSIVGDGPALPIELNPKEFSGFQLAVLNKALKPQGLRNPYDIPREHLLDQLSRMRRNLLNASVCNLRGQDQDQIHSVPIAQMGNYQDFLKQCPSPLREADPDQPKRLHTFGNPFKLDKKAMMVDEADEFVTGTQGKGKRPGEPSSPAGGGAPKRRRCMSPLLRPGRAYTPPNKTPPRVPENNHSAVGNHVGHVEPDPTPDLEPSPESAAPPPDLQRNHLEVDEEEEEEQQQQQQEPMQEPMQENGQSNEEELSVDGEEDEQVTRRYPSPNQLKKIRKEEGKELNTELRVLITKEIRKPGRRYEKIFYLLKQIQGSLETRLIFLQNIIKEAARFKKRVLIEQLENFLEEIHLRANNMNHLDGF
ncbi:integrator complex subunit 6 isoform X1 [Salminus brasiliensis]|uniref:integrator complex subunit 6 isoform X1 n=1 Tax=Salminus brasiliensis TaxID=930266 RepID=UPI003B8344EF